MADMALLMSRTAADIQNHFVLPPIEQIAESVTKVTGQSATNPEEPRRYSFQKEALPHLNPTAAPDLAAIEEESARKMSLMTDVYTGVGRASIVDDEEIERISKENPTHTDKSIWSRLKEAPEGDPNEQDTETEKEKPPVKGRFRTLARMIKTNLAWAHDHDEKSQDDATEAFVVKQKNAGEALVFDVSHFKAKRRGYGGLTGNARGILMKHPLERSEEELHKLKDVVERLDCFSRYPPKVRHELTRVIFHEHFDDGRVVIQQGHIGQSFYFVVSGSVLVQISEQDKKTGVQQTQILGELTEGSTFGELALLHDIRRTATIICKGACDFLRIDKQDFELVLRVSYEREWKERLDCLTWFQQLQEWGEQELLLVNNTCKLKEYHPEKLIIGNTTLLPDNVYFIVSGECRVVREIILAREAKEYGKFVYKLATQEQVRHMKSRVTETTRLDRSTIDEGWIPERQFWTIGTLSKGFYFGTGEDLTDTYITSKTKVELLMVPRVHFSKNKMRSRTLERMREDLDNALPTNDEAFKKLFEERSWEKYKRQVVGEVVTRRCIPRDTSVQDVPEAIREASQKSKTDYTNYA